MSQIMTQIRPATGPVGPYFVVTEKDGETVAVATGLALGAAFNRARDDQATAVGGMTIQRVIINTNTQ